VIKASALDLPGIRHGFFTREDGVSKGIFASLNCGLGSGDDRTAVVENRTRVAVKLGVERKNLLSVFQVHGVDVVTVTGPWPSDDTRPKADAMVCNTPGVALGILTADCGPLLFADAKAGVIGAAHAGWKGALHGVAGTTISAMEKLGAERANIVAVIGPTISHESYEVGPDFPAPFLAANPQNKKFFAPSEKAGHHMFNLPGFLADQLQSENIGRVENLDLCTYTEEEWFFSYRRSVHRGEADYGRLISAIALG
jgi:YfiH family protein